MQSLTLRPPPKWISTLLARKIAISAIAYTAWIPRLALADEPVLQSVNQSSESTWGLGVVGMSSQKAYKGISRDNLALPLVYFENHWVRVFGPRVEFKLPSLDITASQKIDFRLLARYDESGYKPDDAAILSGMDERKGGLWAGGKVIWRNDLADISAEVLADASGHSKGQRATLGLEKTFRLGQKVMLVPRVSASWMSKKYVDYYYGVRDNEIRADRPSYIGESAVNVEVGARASYLFNASHSVFIDVGVTSLAKEIKASPLVDRSTENRVSMGYLYRF